MKQTMILLVVLFITTNTIATPTQQQQETQERRRLGKIETTSILKAFNDKQSNDKQSNNNLENAVDCDNLIKIDQDTTLKEITAEEDLALKEEAHEDAKTLEQVTQNLKKINSDPKKQTARKKHIDEAIKQLETEGKAEEKRIVPKAIPKLAKPNTRPPQFVSDTHDINGVIRP